MKKILAYMSPEKDASLFDVIVAYDSGADVVVPYPNADSDVVRDLVYSSVFTRHPDDLKNTAIFIGGHDVDRGEELLKSVLETFRGLPDFFRVSVAVDPDGSYTTSSGCVVKIKKSLGGRLSGLKATVLAGTGPVGQRIAVLLAREGCDVTVTSRKLDRAESARDMIEKNYNIRVRALEVKDEKSTEKAVSGSDIVISTGPEGVTLLPKKIWSKHPIKVMADVNAVPPYGVEGVDARDNCKEIEGKIGIGALAIGGLKMKCHHRLVENLFKEKGIIFDLEKVYKIAESI